ncbi:MAG TPA: DUF5658 family protein [Capsulimonadaceae bacterium]
MFKRDIVLAQEYLGFLLFNLFDLFLTGYIFRHSGQEANGLALWVLHTFGLRGFAIFKFLMVIFIIVICDVISLYSLERARQVITGACVLYLLVIFWETFLIFDVINRPIAVHTKQTALPVLRDALLTARGFFVEARA